MVQHHFIHLRQNKPPKLVSLKDIIDLKIKKRFIVLFILILTTSIFIFWLSPEIPQTQYAESHAIIIDGPYQSNSSFPSEACQHLIDSLKATIASDRVKAYQVQYGDSFNSIFESLGIDKSQTIAINSLLYKDFDQNDFQAGDPYFVHYMAGKNKPSYITYPLDPKTEWLIHFDDQYAEIRSKHVTSATKKLSAKIDGSLGLTINNLNAPEDLTDKILSIFAWQFDCGMLEKGDAFDMVYEEEYVDGQTIGSGAIWAIRFYHKQQYHFGYGFDNGNGIEYFDEKGNNLSHAPLLFDIISSTYSRSRLHPVRHKYRPHLGMDFVAKKGTTVEAIKAGEIIESTFRKANGNYVKILHDDGILTQYLHLSKLEADLRPGVRVAKGAKIGEVGNTGLSSGPHLCLRVWKNGKQCDPLSFDFPARAPITSENTHRFKNHMEQYSVWEVSFDKNLISLK
jgi:murein DD-endopeptidase MepM/ murein hydrolase activator NlpD